MFTVRFKELKKKKVLLERKYLGAAEQGGHRCTNSVNTKQGQRKQWSIKSVEADEPKTTTETTIEECEIPEASHRGEWNDVNKRGTGKKRNNHLVREVHCENGFGALEIGNDHLEKRSHSTSSLLQPIYIFLTMGHERQYI